MLATNLLLYGLSSKDKIVPACGRYATATAPIRSNGPVSVTVNFRPGPPRHKEGEGCLKHPPHFAELNS